MQLILQSTLQVWHLTHGQQQGLGARRALCGAQTRRRRSRPRTAGNRGAKQNSNPGPPSTREGSFACSARALKAAQRRPQPARAPARRRRRACATRCCPPRQHGHQALHHVVPQGEFLGGWGSIAPQSDRRAAPVTLKEGARAPTPRRIATQKKTQPRACACTTTRRCSRRAATRSTSTPSSSSTRTLSRAARTGELCGGVGFGAAAAAAAGRRRRPR